MTNPSDLTPDMFPMMSVKVSTVNWSQCGLCLLYLRVCHDGVLRGQSFRTLRRVPTLFVLRVHISGERRPNLALWSMLSRRVRHELLQRCFDSHVSIVELHSQGVEDVDRWFGICCGCLSLFTPSSVCVMQQAYAISLELGTSLVCCNRSM